MDYILHFSTAIMFAGVGIFLFGLGYLFTSVSHLIDIAGYSGKRREK